MDTGNTRMEFKSAVDPLFYGLIVVVGVLMAALVYPLAKNQQQLLMLSLAMAVVVSVALWVVATTRYFVTPTHLIVQRGTFIWKIQLDDITSVRKIRTLVRGTASSVDRLEIRYGRLNSIKVSPRERDRFMKALGVGTRLHGWG